MYDAEKNSLLVIYRSSKDLNTGYEPETIRTFHSVPLWTEVEEL